MNRSVLLRVRGWEVRLLLERREGGESLFWLRFNRIPIPRVVGFALETLERIYNWVHQIFRLELSAEYPQEGT